MTRYCIECGQSLYEYPMFHCDEYACPLYLVVQVGIDNPLNARSREEAGEE